MEHPQSIRVLIHLYLSPSVITVGFLFLTGCASSAYKARQEQREKIANTAGLYCDWISGDKHTDIEVELNLQMGKRCDSSKPFTLTNYKNASDQNGILYCCAMAGAEAKSSERSSKRASGPAVQKTSPSSGASESTSSSPAAGDDIVEDK